MSEPTTPRPSTMTWYFAQRLCDGQPFGMVICFERKEERTTWIGNGHPDYAGRPTRAVCAFDGTPPQYPWS